MSSEQPPSQSLPFFSVYRGVQAIELHPGCEDRHNLQVIYSSKSYSSAYIFAQAAAKCRGVELIDFYELSLLK
jgi:hypothetical protein